MGFPPAPILNDTSVKISVNQPSMLSNIVPEPSKLQQVTFAKPQEFVPISPVVGNSGKMSPFDNKR